MQRASPFLLAVPYLIGIAVLKGLTVEIDTFHGSDAAIYQLPTIVHFREGLDFSDYPSAQTPLFHLVMAGWSKLVPRAQRESGVDFRLHDLRHSFASFLVNDGERLNVVQKLLGHTNPRTTQRYAHLSPERLGNAAETVATILKDLDGP